MNLSSKFKQIRTKHSIDPKIDSKYLFEKILSSLKSYSTEVLYTDGLKFILDDSSWILIRFSNTEHALRISLESTKEKVDSMHKLFHNKILEIYEKV
jgi:phosphomannomutase